MTLQSALARAKRADCGAHQWQQHLEHDCQDHVVPFASINARKPELCVIARRVESHQIFFKRSCENADLKHKAQINAVTHLGFFLRCVSFTPAFDGLAGKEIVMGNERPAPQGRPQSVAVADEQFEFNRWGILRAAAAAMAITAVSRSKIASAEGSSICRLIWLRC
ncbi:hypothetical protein [Bradyrhizobium sp. 23AC]